MRDLFADYRYVQTMRFMYKKFACFIITVFCWSVFNVQAETQYKLGIGLGNVSANDYPGSSESQSITSPIPYLQIKTDWFDLDREGLHTNFFANTNFRLDFSFDFGLPVKSSENTARNGMPDLHPVGQVGPLLIYQLIDDPDLKWQIQFPVTYAYAFDNLDMEYIGWFANPRVYIEYLVSNKNLPLDISASFGPVFGSENYHQYYYSVDNSYQTVDRAAYNADAGPGGYRFNFSVTRRMNGYWLGLYVRYQNLSNAVFADSPLVEQQSYWMIAVGASWLFAGNL